MKKGDRNMSEQLAALTALRGIRGELDECKEGNLGIKRLDELLSKCWIQNC